MESDKCLGKNCRQVKGLKNRKAKQASFSRRHWSEELSQVWGVNLCVPGTENQGAKTLMQRLARIT